MAEGKGGKILSITKKRAKRVQEKMMQKLGKSDQTKDEVYEEFVTNFNKQQIAANKLQKELLRYMNSLRVLQQSTRSLCDTLGDLYEPEWKGFSSHKDIMEQKLLLWEDLLTTLTSKMVEPMTNYISRFPDARNRIAKRERKVVDYDLTRRELESLRGKPKVNDQKVQQAEEAFTHAKQLYDEITDELYEELPAFYDSRVQFYASVFQSIAAAESKFHAEITKVDEKFAELMDALAAEAATGMHSTKKERNVDTVPKLLSRPGEDSDEDSEGELRSPVNHSDPTLEENAANSVESPSSTPSSSTTPTPTPTRTPSTTEKKPGKPTPSASGSSLKRQPPTKPARSTSTLEQNDVTTGNNTQPLSPADDVETTPKEADSASRSPSPPPPQLEETGDLKSPKTKAAPPKPAPFRVPLPPTAKEDGDSGKGEMEGSEKKTEKDTETNGTAASEGEEGTTTKIVPTQDGDSKEVPDEATEQGSSGTENAGKSVVPEVLYKVVASHPYEGEDEDELSFDKGTIVLVIPYDDPEDEEEGWLMGVIEETGARGIFPSNFTKRLE